MQREEENRRKGKGKRKTAALSHSSPSSSSSKQEITAQNKRNNRRHGQGLIKLKKGVLVGGATRGGPFSALSSSPSSSTSSLKIMRRRSSPYPHSPHSPSQIYSITPWLDDQQGQESDANRNEDFGKLTTLKAIRDLPPLRSVSARKLAASLWELHSLSVMKKAALKESSSRSRDKSPLQLPHPCSDICHSPAPVTVTMSNGSNRRYSHALNERNNGALQALTPGSCSSSIEVGAIEQAATPTSSLDLKIKPTDAGYSLTTSTELLKVLNRIWSLEEQHASSMSLVTTLRVELDHARSKVHELLQEQRADRRQMENLIKRFTDEKIVWKSKMQEKIRAAIQSVRDELEDERKLRRRSESLHRKLSRELAEIKAAFAKTLQEVEKERKARNLVEDFCDKLAIEVTKDGDKDDTEKNLGKVKTESAKEAQLLNMAELWKEERVHAKLAEARFEIEQKEAIMETLRNEVEAFLKDKRENAYQNDVGYPQQHKRQSIESLHLNCTSAPQDAGDEESIDSDMHSIELNRNSLDDNVLRGYKLKFSSLGVPNEEKGRRSFEKVNSCPYATNIHSFQEKSPPYQEPLGTPKSLQGSKPKSSEKLKSSQPNYTKKVGRPTEQDQVTQERQREGRSLRNDAHVNGKGSKYAGETLARTKSAQSECCGGKDDFDDTPDCNPSHSSWRSFGGGIDNLLGAGHTSMHGVSSPIRQWNHQQLYSDCPRGIRENSLKAKLLEARLEGQQARLRNARGL